MRTDDTDAARAGAAGAAGTVGTPLFAGWRGTRRIEFVCSDGGYTIRGDGQELLEWTPGQAGAALEAFLGQIDRPPRGQITGTGADGLAHLVIRLAPRPVPRSAPP